MEGAADAPLYKEHYLVKAGAVSVEHAEIDYYMAFVVYGVYLFKAAVAAAHARRHYNKHRFFHFLKTSPYHDFQVCFLDYNTDKAIMGISIAAV